jgi:circadian clock protein KaiB
MNTNSNQCLMEGQDEGIWLLRLYVAGQTPKSVRAFANLRQICEKHLAGKYKIEIIDLVENPEIGRSDQKIGRASCRERV